MAQFGPVPGRPRGAGGVPDDCNTIATVQGWYKEADLPASGAITTWTDSGADGEDITQSTADNKPTKTTLGSGKGANFDGNDSLVSVGTHTDGTADVFTFATTFKMDSLPSDAILFGHDSTDDRAINVESTGLISLRTGASSISLTATGEITTGVQYIIVLGRDSSGNLWIYKDGVDILSGTPNNTSDLTINAMGETNGTKFFTGTVGETCWWDTDQEANEQAIHDYIDYVN